MSMNVQVEISIQEILCWVGLILLAWNPSGAFSGVIESMGYEVPLLMLASGAGAPGVENLATKFLNGGTNQ